MVFQPNYRFKKAQRARVKESRKEGQDAGTPGPAEAAEAEAAPSCLEAKTATPQGDDD